jgi:UDP-N-acetylglucosamine 3-dehydrogenase
VDTIRVAVIGLGWFGEIHCDAIIGVPNLKLAALCTRTPERLKAMAAKFGVRKTTPDYRDLLADPEIDAVSIVTMWDSAYRARRRRPRSWQARLSREADGVDRRRLP